MAVPLPMPLSKVCKTSWGVHETVFYLIELFPKALIQTLTLIMTTPELKLFIVDRKLYLFLIIAKQYFVGIFAVFISFTFLIK